MSSQLESSPASGRQRGRRGPIVLGVVLALLASTVLVGAVARFVPSSAAVPAAVDLYDVVQAGSQIMVNVDETWAKTTAPAVTPGITNYEYSTDGGTTWVAFDPPVTTPVYNDVADLAPALGICTESDTGDPLEPGSYNVMLRAVNADGPGAASAAESLTFSDFDFYEMNPCGGTWGGAGPEGHDRWPRRL